MEIFAVIYAPRSKVKPPTKIGSTLLCEDFYDVVHTISPCFKVFDQKRDHSEIDLIKSVNIKVNLNITYRNHVKHTCETQIRSSLLC